MSCTSVSHRRSWQRSRDNDWVESTLEDLTQTSYRLSSYGLNGWFPESILELESILEQRNLPRLYSREARCLYSELMMDIRYRTMIMRKGSSGIMVLDQPTVHHSLCNCYLICGVWLAVMQQVRML